MRLTEDQVAFRAVVRRLLAASPADLWSRLVELGAPALTVPAEHGGLGAGLAEVHVVQYELGRTIAATPMLSSVLATSALPPGDLLAAVAAGTTVAALAWSEPDGRWSGCATACPDGTLTGHAAYVLDGDTADTLLVVAATGDGPALYQVDPTTVRRTRTPAMDHTRTLAEVVLDRTPGVHLGPFDAARVRDVACAALASEQAGTAARCLELTVEHTMRRVQFGRPIGGFQALKHRMADLHVLVETAASAALAAATAGPADLPARAAAAKAYCAEALRTVAGEIIQLHGGIAITWEHDAHRYFKRAHGGAQLFGAPSTYIDRLATLAGF
ncbi:acyl-CoA dehydrogenase family protein [Actinophytocola sediminis]